MRRFLFASHAYFADGIMSSLKLVMGEQEDVNVLCAYTDEDYDIKLEIRRYIEKLPSEDELIVVTDVLGGSVNNEFMSMIEHTDKSIFLIAGLNLPLIMNLMLKKGCDCPTADMIRECIQEAKESICFCNELISTDNHIEDDEF